MTVEIPTRHSDEMWHDCAGEVGRLVRRLRWRRRSTQIRIGALVAILIGIALTGNYFSSAVESSIELKFTGRPCTHYVEEMRAVYCDHSAPDLDEAFWNHVAKCPDCERDLNFYGAIGRDRRSRAARPGASAAFPQSALQSAYLDSFLKSSMLAAAR